MDSHAEASRSLHESLVELLPDAVLVLDEAAGRFVLANAAAERLFGRPRQELARLSLRDLVQPGDQGQLERAESAVRGTGSWRGELWLRRQNGTYVPCDVVAQALTVEGRALMQFCCQDAGGRWHDRALQQAVEHAAERLSAPLDQQGVLQTIVTAALPGLADAVLLELPATDEAEAVTLAAFADPAAIWAHTVVDDAPTAETVALIRGGQALCVPLVAGGQTIGTLTLNHASGRRWEPSDWPLVERLANHAAHALDQAGRWSTTRRELDHQAALTRIVSALDADDAEDRIHQVLLQEAIRTLAAEDAGIARWDAERGVLVQALSPAGKWTGAVLDRERSLVGLAAAELRPLIENEYQRRMGTHTPAGRAGAKAVLAVPLIHRDMLLGSMSVSQLQSPRKFQAADARRLEELASAAALALAGVERHRFAGARLVAQEAAHLLNNDLMMTMGSLELLGHRSDLPATIQPLMETAMDGLAHATQHVRQLQQIRRVVVGQGPFGPRLDLGRSTS